MDSQRRNNVLAFKSEGSKDGSRFSKIDSVKCVMVRARLRDSPAVAVKAERLHALAPKLAAIVEELIDDFLAEVS